MRCFPWRRRRDPDLSDLNNVQYGRVPDTRGWTDVI